ncbi:MAG TPA: glycosyltransferase [Elusimicrobiota bacterium]|nr:glycosyltransferase [Elusimicrobiota bacterium]
MERPRVLHLNTERTWRGGERQLFFLAKELQRRGYEQRVACRPGFPLERFCRQAGLSVVPVSPWGEFDLWAAGRLRRAMRDEKIDILHAHTGHAVGLGALALRRGGPSFIATRRVDFPLKKNFLSRWKYRRVDRLVAISGKVRDVLTEGGMDPARIPVVHSGIEGADYPSAGDKARLRKEKGLPVEGIFVTQVAALVPHKDHATLLAAARRVCDKLPSLRFFLLGDGELRSGLERKTRELGLSDNVVFLGHRMDALDYIALADAFVLSSVEEGLGTSLLDALFIGVPVVATRAGGIPEIFGSPSAPELVPARAPDELADQLVRVLSDRAYAEQRVTRGREIVKKFSVSAMADAYEKMYKELSRRKYGIT